MQKGTDEFRKGPCNERKKTEESGQTEKKNLVQTRAGKQESIVSSRNSVPIVSNMVVP